MFKHLKRKKPEKTGEPQIGPKEVNALEVDPAQRNEFGRYSGRLLNPDDLFFPDKYIYPAAYEKEQDHPLE